MRRGDKGPNPPSDLIQVSRFETFLRRMLGIKGAGLVRGINPDVSFSTDPSNAGLFADLFLLAGYRMFGFGHGVAAGGAGITGALSLYNPVGSNTILSVWAASIQCTAGAPEIAVIDVDPVTLLAQVAGFRDSRLSFIGGVGQARGAAFLRSSTIAVAALPTRTVIGGAEAGGLAQSQGVLQNAVVLTPGFGILLTGGANLAANFVISWLERTMENSERNS